MVCAGPRIASVSFNCSQDLWLKTDFVFHTSSYPEGREPASNCLTNGAIHLHPFSTGNDLFSRVKVLNFHFFYSRARICFKSGSFPKLELNQSSVSIAFLKEANVRF